MRWFFEVASIAIVSSWRWLLASVGVVAALVGILFAVGVFGGGDDGVTNLATALPTPTPAAAGTPVPTLSPTPESTITPVPKVISVPILATRATNLGSLEFVLAYDPARLEFAQLEPGILAGSAIIESGFSQPGKVWGGIIDVQGMNGSGSVAVVKFNVRDEVGGTTPLTLESIAAFDAISLVDILTTSTPGQYTGPSLAPLSPIVTFQ